VRSVSRLDKMEQKMKIKGLIKKLNFKVKMGLLFCLLPFLIGIIYATLLSICKCKLPPLLNIPYVVVVAPLRGLEIAFQKVFFCGKDSGSSFNCWMTLIAFPLLYFLIFFIAGWVLAYFIEKSKKWISMKKHFYEKIWGDGR